MIHWSALLVAFVIGVLVAWFTCPRRCRPRVSVGSLVVGTSPIDGGLGVFATRDIPVGVQLDSCPTLGLEVEGICPHSRMCDYVFQAPDGNERSALVAWGKCSLYNHRTGSNNASFEAVKRNGEVVVEITSVKPIKAGEEVFVDYGPGYWESRGIKPRS